MRRPTTLRSGLALGLVALLASCAPLTTPGVTPPPAPGAPPAPAPGRPAPAPAAPAKLPPLELTGEPLITVGLAWDLDTLVMTPAPGFVPVEPRWPNGHKLAATPRIRVRKVGTFLRVEQPRGPGWDATYQPAAGETLWLAGKDLEAVTATWRGQQWRGALGVFENPRGRLTLVARLPLECYLRGVVPGEIGALGDDRIEAGKAQAIAARSYTLFYMGRRAAEGFDVYSSVEDQFYSPMEGERPLASRCVNETRGETALYDGQPIRANYSSTCGGISADVWEAWPAEGLPYLVSHRDRHGGDDWCQASAHYRWHETWSVNEFMANVQRYGTTNGLQFPPAGLGELEDVRVRARSRSGRVWWLDVYTSTGRIPIPAYVIRQVLRRGGQPGSILRSNLFKIGVRRDPKTNAPLAVVASGAGSGHGVGLCQTGALGMARAGEKARDILEHYYPGAHVRALY